MVIDDEVIRALSEEKIFGYSNRKKEMLLRKRREKLFRRTLCWFDIETLYKHLQPHSIQKAFVVPEGGEELCALLCLSIPKIIVVEAKVPQRALVELKLLGMRKLRASGMETLLGLNPGGRRVFLYHQLRKMLSGTSCAFWDSNEEYIRLGLAKDMQFLYVSGPWNK